MLVCNGSPVSGVNSTVRIRSPAPDRAHPSSSIHRAVKNYLKEDSPSIILKASTSSPTPGSENDEPSSALRRPHQPLPDSKRLLKNTFRSPGYTSASERGSQPHRRDWNTAPRTESQSGRLPWVPDPPQQDITKWIAWVREYSSPDLLPSLATKALRNFGVASAAASSNSDPSDKQSCTRVATDTLQISPNIILDSVNSLLSACILNERTNPEVVLEQVSRSQFLCKNLHKHGGCIHAVSTLFVQAATAQKTYSDPISISQLCVAQVRLACPCSLFWDRLSTDQVSKLSSFPAPQLVNIAWAAAHLQISIPPLCALHLRQAIMRVLEDCCERNVATLMWAFARNPCLRGSSGPTPLNEFIRAPGNRRRPGRNHLHSRFTPEDYIPAPFSGNFGFDGSVNSPKASSAGHRPPSYALPPAWVREPDLPETVRTASTSSKEESNPLQSADTDVVVSKFDSRTSQPEPGSEEATFEHVWKSLVDKAVDLAPSMSNRSLSTAAWAVGRLWETPFGEAQELIQDGLSQLSTMNAHETSSILWACASREVVLTRQQAETVALHVASLCADYLKFREADKSGVVEHQAAYTSLGYFCEVMTPRGFSICTRAMGKLHIDLLIGLGSTAQDTASLPFTQPAFSFEERMHDQYKGVWGTIVTEGALQRTLRAMLPHFTPRELISAVSGLSTLQNTALERMQGAMQRCDGVAVLSNVAANMGAYSAIELCAVLCMATRLEIRWGVHQEKIVTALLMLAGGGEAEGSGVISLPPRLVANLAWVLGRSRKYIFDDQGAVEKLMCRSCNLWSAQQVANVVWALGECGHDVAGELRGLLVAAVKRTVKLMDCQELAMVMLGLVKTQLGLSLCGGKQSDVWGASRGSDDVTPNMIAESLEQSILSTWPRFTAQTAAAVSWAVMVDGAWFSDSRAVRAMRAALWATARDSNAMEAAISLHSASVLSHAAADYFLGFGKGLFDGCGRQAQPVQVLDGGGRLLRKLLLAVSRTAGCAPAQGVLCSLLALQRLVQLASEYDYSPGGINTVLVRDGVGESVAGSLFEGAAATAADMSTLDAVHAANAFVVLGWSVPPEVVQKLPESKRAALKLEDREGVEPHSLFGAG